MKNQYVFFASVILGAAFLLIQCTDDEALNSQSGTLVLKITDAASDDADIKGIFITVAEVKLDDKPIRNFKPQTIEISKFKNGKTSLLIEKKLPAKSHDRLSLVLATGTNNKDSISGCYVLTKNNIKHNLFASNSNSGSIEISVSNTFELLPGSESHMVIDFDLRKAIVRSTAGTGSFSFVTVPELEKAVRLINEETTGSISGNVQAKDLEYTHYYVYAYRSGEFNASAEASGAGKSQVLFSNAVTSTRVEPDGNYYLPFIEEGDYDIRIASFKQTSENIFVFNGIARTTSIRSGVFLNNISVAAGSETELNIVVFNLH